MLFHIGHLNLLKNAKGMCDRLVVGVTVDELVTYKGKRAMIPFEDRIEIVRSIKYVDAAIPQYDMDKLSVCKKLGASVLFVGDDWYATDKWKQYETNCFFPDCSVFRSFCTSHDGEEKPDR